MDIIGVLPVRIDFQDARRSVTPNPGLLLLVFTEACFRILKSCAVIVRSSRT
jgi:hypothetical protein